MWLPFNGKLYMLNKNHALIKHGLHQVPEIEHHDLTLANECMSQELMGSMQKTGDKPIAKYSRPCTEGGVEVTGLDSEYQQSKLDSSPNMMTLRVMIGLLCLQPY